jgi:uncharacterized protein YggE
MGGDAVTVISVRGEAQRTIPPDRAVLTCAITATRPAKIDALRAAADLLTHLRDALGELGSVPLTPESEGSALTWSAYASRTYPEQQLSTESGRHELTGQVVASVELNLAVRDFRLLERLGTVLAGEVGLDIHHVRWQVDDDNPAWPALRAEAIHAAVRQARHYAAALGGTLGRIESLADAGLLASHEIRPVRAAAVAHHLARGDGGDAPSLDPVPERITAAVDARFIGSGLSIEES